MNLLLSTDYADIPRDQWPKIVTRKEILANGLKHYFTGKECKWGHVGIRYRDGLCQPCRQARDQSYRKTEKSKAYRKAYQKAYSQTDKFKAYQKDYNQTERGKACKRTYRLSENNTKSWIRMVFKNQLNLDHRPDIPEEFVKAIHAQRLLKRKIKSLTK